MSIKRFKSLLFKSTCIHSKIERAASKTRPDISRLLNFKKIFPTLINQVDWFMCSVGATKADGRLIPAQVKAPAYTKTRRRRH